MAISAYLRDQTLDTVFVGPVYVSLHSSDPALTGAAEVSGGTYARQLVTFAPSAGGEKRSNSVVDFTGVPAGTVSDVGLWDAVSGGNFLWGLDLPSPVSVAAGKPLRIPSGGLVPALV